jgi:hypothetical protein
MEQFPFPVQASRKAAEPGASSEDSMAWDEQGDGIGATGISNSARGPGKTKPFGEFAGAERLTGAEPAHFGPNAALKIGMCGEVERRQGIRILAGQDGADRSGSDRVPAKRIGRNAFV